MSSDGDKLYMKSVAFIEMYNFIVQTFFIWSQLEEKNDILPSPDLDSISTVWPQYDFKIKKGLTTKLQISVKGVVFI
jgi:hypothetical protein